MLIPTETRSAPSPDVARVNRLSVRILALEAKLKGYGNCQGRAAIDNEINALKRQRALIRVGSDRG